MKEQMTLIYKKIGSARLIVGGFFLLLVAITYVLGLSFADTMSDVCVRWGMNCILVLAMVPAVRSGVGLNFGLPLGIICGLLGGVLSLEWGFTGVPSLIVAILLSIPFAIVVGILYGLLLNKLKGSEMMVATYVGFSLISLMCIVWLFLPITNPALSMTMGSGIRQAIDLSKTFGHILDNFWLIKLGDFRLPLGYILVCLAICGLLQLFLNTRIGTMMTVAGENPAFASSIGIPVNRTRILGTVLSTILGAVGILFYSQSYGYMQLYESPLMMGFSAVAGILIGGATTKKAGISHVLIGTLLFNGVLALSMPVANAVAPQSNLAEIVRVVVSNGIIVYALTTIKKEG